MTAQVCRKLRRRLPAPRLEQSVMVSSDVAILAGQRADYPTTHERIIDLYDDLRPSLYAYLCTLGVSSDQAEDIIQEAFLRLVRYRFERCTHENLRAWVFRVAHNLSMDVHRFQRRWFANYNENEQPHTIIRHRADPGPTPEQQVILDERRRRFEEAFAQLTPKQRRCVLLRAEGFRYREIAVSLGVSVQRVGELMQRSIVLLEADT